MRQFNKFRGTKGFIVLWERMLRFRHMITEQAKQRCRILAFWEKHGNAATQEAFKISRATLFRWQKALRKGNGKLESLNAKSRCPKNKRDENTIFFLSILGFIVIVGLAYLLGIDVHSKQKSK